MLVAYLPIIAIVVGVLAYALSTNAKIAEIGRILLFCGLLALLLHR